MANEEKDENGEVIIPEEKDEPELDADGNPIEKKEEPELDADGKPIVKKVVAETPEAKHARLKRQLEQQEKRMGIKKDAVVTKKEEKKDELSQADIFTLVKADIDEDDIEEVKDFAKLKKITIKEALKSGTLKAILAERKEERDTANASNTGAVRRSSSKPSADTLLDEARKGKMPEDESDIKAMIKKRKGIK